MRPLFLLLLLLALHNCSLKAAVEETTPFLLQLNKPALIDFYLEQQNKGLKGKDLKKIAAIGIRVKKWVAYHGFSINLSNDLKQYEKIIPCGIKEKGITSMQDMGVKDFSNIDETIISKFLNFFP